MEIEHHERARFLVTAHGDTFLVDCLAYRGNGACDCVHFAARIRPEIERLISERQFNPGKQHMCPHLEAAHWKLHFMLLKSLAKQFPDNRTE